MNPSGAESEPSPSESGPSKPANHDQSLTLDHDEQSRHYRAREGAATVGRIDYLLSDAVMTIVHTETDPRLQGRGVAAQLTTFALNDARARGWRVRAQCSYARAFLARHPEYADLLG